MTNDQMREGRFANWAKYRRLVAKVSDAVMSGREVHILVGRSDLKFSKPDQLECLKATKSGVFVQRGKSWVCIMDRAVSPSRVYAT